MNRGTSHGRQRGAGLIEPLVALVILSFGLIGLAHFQVGTVKQMTDAQARLAASAAAEDLLTQVRVDLSNAACYQVPAAGACTSPFAKAQAAAWAAQVPQALPGFVSAAATLNGNLFTVSVNWTAKASSDARTQTVITDVRP
jgi:type IV pilus assembly protein PilV